MELIFATHNQNKVQEVQTKLGGLFQVRSLHDIGWEEDIPETSETLRGNAMIKVKAVFDETGLPCFADDTGLIIDTLNGRPGVRSARYASEAKDSEANMDKVLDEMKLSDNRRARFKTYIALVISGKVFGFEGTVEGQISHERRGGTGFGYDPIFLPEGYNRSFAEMTMEEKNEVSHRARAVEKLIHFLSKQV